MYKMNFTKRSLKGLGYYWLLALTALLVPSNLMDASQTLIYIVVGFYVYLWYRILKFIWLKLVEDDDKYRWDFLIYDLIYMFGLTIIFNFMMLKVGRNLWHVEAAMYAFYGGMFIVLFIKIILMKSRFYHMVRYVITWLFILGNLLVINQFLTMWFGMNFLGQGF